MMLLLQRRTNLLPTAAILVIQAAIVSYLPTISTAWSYCHVTPGHRRSTRLNSSPADFFDVASTDEIEDFSHFSDDDMKGYFHRPDGDPEDDPLHLYSSNLEDEVEEDNQDQYEEYGFTEDEIAFMRSHEAKEREGKKVLSADVYRYFLLYQDLVARAARNKPQVWNLDAFTKRKSWPPRQAKVQSETMDEDDENKEEEEELAVFLEDNDIPEYLRDVHDYKNRTQFERVAGLQDDAQLDLSKSNVRFSQEVSQIKQDLAIPETFLDEWYTEEEVERFRTQPDGEDPTRKTFEAKPFMNNRFTDPKEKTDFTKLDPYRARKTAVQLARATNNEWLPEGYSAGKKASQFEEMEKRGILAGTIRPGPCDPDTVKRIQPAINVFNGCVNLLSIQDGVYRFHYHGLIRHKHGMKSYMLKLLKECDVHVTGVVFETGRERDSRDTSFVF